MTNLKIVTVRFIRFENKTEKITIEEAIDLLKVDHSHRQYTRDYIKQALERGTLMGVTNKTFQIVGVGYDKDLRTEQRKKETKEKKKRILRSIKDSNLKPDIKKLDKL